MTVADDFLFTPASLEPDLHAVVVDQSDDWADEEQEGFQVLLTDNLVIVRIRVNDDEHAVTIPVVALLEALEQQGKERGN